MKKILLIILTVMMLCSCNWGILNGKDPAMDPDQGSADSFAVFTGAAPRNIQATKSSYTDSIVVSFDAVRGADYYRIYRTSVPRSENLLADSESYDWKRVEYDLIPENNTGRIYWTDNSINQATKTSTKYLYRVLAQSYLSPDANVIASYSDIAQGWTLSPPATITATGGLSQDVVYLSWDPVDSIKGYNVYYSTDELAPENAWSKANTHLIPAPPRVEMQESFAPPESLKGADLYFRVVSVSNSNAESERSGMAHGWTLVPGAPEAPSGIVPSKADSPQVITVKWAKPQQESTSNVYTWEVRRNAPGEEQQLIATFRMDNKTETGSDDSGNEGETVKARISVRAANNASIKLENDIYTLTDSSPDLQPNVEYTYKIRAISKVEDETTGELKDAIGQEATAIAYLMSPPTEFTNLSATYPSGPDKGSFSFTIAEPPMGFDASSDDWSYVIWGRNNVRGKIQTDWTEGIIDNVKVEDGPVTINIGYETAKGTFNEFSVSVIDNDDNDKTKRYGESDGSVIAAGLPATPVLNIMANKISGGSPNSNGVYPLYFSISGSEYIQDLELEIIKSSNPTGAVPEIHEVSASSSATAFASEYYPSKVGEIWTYRVRGIDPFGRYTDWSGYLQGYGAITGNAFIKFFEAYGLKPWEFVGKSDFPANLKTKWNNSTIHKLIDVHGMGSLGEVTESSEYHNGTIYYHSYVGSGLSGDVDFRYTNFGELETICTNGSYKMSGVNVSGNNGVCSGTITVTGMYPATVDFSALRVANYGLSGNYRVTQDNGKGLEEVGATRNE